MPASSPLITISPLATEIDFTIQNGGSIIILRGHSQECVDWLNQNVRNDETQTFGGGIVVEPRYIEPILDGLQAEGFFGRNL